jgi:pyruvate kinase
MLRRTKIIATLGPSTEGKEQIHALSEAGMNIARLNFSHGTYEQFKKIAKNIRAVAKEDEKIITIMQDLQGPKIRIGDLGKAGWDAEEVKVKKGEIIKFTSKAKPKTSKKSSGKTSIVIPIPYPLLTKVLKKGDSLLIEDGLIRTKIVSIKDNSLRAKVISGGIIKSRKGVNIPDSKLPASASLTSKDKKDLAFGVKTLKVDAIAVSFVEDAEDLRRIRREIQKHSKRPIKVIAKIERREALRNLKEILKEADGVMVARGDLGIETKAERVPIEQKRILTMARSQGKPTIIATQILQSMVENPLPTRAEVSDAAHAIFELADAFMLSNETAVGRFPVRAVKTLARVARETENAIFKNTDLFPIQTSKDPDLVEDEAMALSAARIAEEIDAEAIVVLTKEGFTARTVLKHRPKTPVIVITNSKDTAQNLNFLWGIKEIILHKGVFRSEEIKTFLKKTDQVKRGDEIILIKLSNTKRSLVEMKI